MLKKAGHDAVPIVVPENGCVSCVEVITEQKPDLILMDILMPGVDGNQHLVEIRKTWSRLELPVIMVTSKAESTDISESFKLGANDYITKPIIFDVAIRRIETHLQMAALSKSVANIKELDAIGAMIATYNHEINNPLAIAMGLIGNYVDDHPEMNPEDVSAFEKVETALQRIADIVQKTQDVLKTGSVEYQKYVESKQMIKFK